MPIKYTPNITHKEKLEQLNTETQRESEPKTYRPREIFVFFLIFFILFLNLCLFIFALRLLNVLISHIELFQAVVKFDHMTDVAALTWFANDGTAKAAVLKLVWRFL